MAVSRDKVARRHSCISADRMPPVRWSQFIGHLLAIIDGMTAARPAGRRRSAADDDDDDA